MSTLTPWLKGEFIWPLELREHGYKTEEIAQLW